MNNIERNEIMRLLNELICVDRKEKINAIEFIKQCGGRGGSIDVGDYISINVDKDKNVIIC